MKNYSQHRRLLASSGKLRLTRPSSGSEHKLPAALLIFALGLVMLSGCEPESGEVLGTQDSIVSISPIEIELDSKSLDSANASGNNLAMPLSCRNSSIINAFNAQQSSVQVKGCGKVTAILPDDNDGSRHQRFIVQLDGVDTQHTILIAHNIDLAPKLGKLNVGDDVLFYGQYEYNPKGGVVHWTHADPAANHQNGWIEHNDHRFE